jgi:hypothetical protein
LPLYNAIKHRWIKKAAGRREIRNARLFPQNYRVSHVPQKPCGLPVASPLSGGPGGMILPGRRRHLPLSPSK